MRNVFILFSSLSLTCSSLIFSREAQDHSKDNEYAKNSESQKASAEDFMQQVQFKGTESILDVGYGNGKTTPLKKK